MHRNVISTSLFFVVIHRKFCILTANDGQLYLQMRGVKILMKRVLAWTDRLVSFENIPFDEMAHVFVCFAFDIQHSWKYSSEIKLNIRLSKHGLVSQWLTFNLNNKQCSLEYARSAKLYTNCDLSSVNFAIYIVHNIGRKNESCSSDIYQIQQ